MYLINQIARELYSYPLYKNCFLYEREKKKKTPRNSSDLNVAKLRPSFVFFKNSNIFIRTFPYQVSFFS